MEITFLGATGTVTGSKYLISDGKQKILVDCGLFQGFKQLRLKNWAKLPVNPKEIDSVILTHAHIDHSGYLPLLIKNGFSGKVYCSRGTRDLCAILLPDSGHLQEEEARYANEHAYSKHSPALPLYTREDAERSLGRLFPVDFDQEISLVGELKFSLFPAGHIVGASLVLLKNSKTSILFSGDLGRPNSLIMNPPTTIRRADYLVVESTYGNRLHDPADPKIVLGECINRAFQRGGVVLIPSFAVGRAQAILYAIHLLKASGAIPDIPVYLNSPMAIEATEIYSNHQKEHRLTPAQCREMYHAAQFVKSGEESKRLNARQGPMIIISASGMATGGRILHHLKAFAPDDRNMVIFVGFQAAGTRGEAMVNGAKMVKIHGNYVPIRAEVVAIHQLSAHADYGEIMAWLRHFETSPRETFVTHGEPAPADALRHRIEEELKWRCRVPEYLDHETLK
ncbi:MAG TPA: MBL fold metallo-hydrolase [Nitrospiria bacterium]|nr:MBL fold metallo-hydrolase [Nitrospiria bacterium]